MQKCLRQETSNTDEINASLTEAEKKYIGSLLHVANGMIGKIFQIYREHGAKNILLEVANIHHKTEIMAREMCTCPLCNFERLVKYNDKNANKYRGSGKCDNMPEITDEELEKAFSKADNTGANTGPEANEGSPDTNQDDG